MTAAAGFGTQPHRNSQRPRSSLRVTVDVRFRSRSARAACRQPAKAAALDEAAARSVFKQQLHGEIQLDVDTDRIVGRPLAAADAEIGAL